MTLRYTATAVAALMCATVANAEIKIGFIGSLSSDTGLSTLRGAEIAIEEFDVSEKIVTKFTLATSWITSSVKYVYVKMGDITSIQNSYIIIE